MVTGAAMRDGSGAMDQDIGGDFRRCYGGWIIGLGVS